jgi:peptidoglycan hydrolase-like protein with peptidoglycan-binding domain
VYEYVQSGKAGAMLAPYTQMAQSAILAIGVKLDVIPAQDVAYLQAGLIRLGFDPGRIDGVQGNRTVKALGDAGADMGDPATWLSEALRAKFPGEYV